MSEHPRTAKADLGRIPRRLLPAYIAQTQAQGSPETWQEALARPAGSQPTCRGSQQPLKVDKLSKLLLQRVATGTSAHFAVQVAAAAVEARKRGSQEDAGRLQPGGLLGLHLVFPSLAHALQAGAKGSLLQRLACLGSAGTRKQNCERDLNTLVRGLGLPVQLRKIPLTVVDIKAIIASSCII